MAERAVKNDTEQRCEVGSAPGSRVNAANRGGSRCSMTSTTAAASSAREKNQGRISAFDMRWGQTADRKSSGHGFDGFHPHSKNNFPCAFAILKVAQRMLLSHSWFALVLNRRSRRRL